MQTKTPLNEVSGVLLFVEVVGQISQNRRNYDIIGTYAEFEI